MLNTNKTIINRLFNEVISQKNLEIINELFSPDFVDHSTPEQARGPEGVKAFLTGIFARIIDLHVIVEDMIAEDHKVVVRTTWKARVKEAGNPIGSSEHTETMIQIFYLNQGKISEEWNEGTTSLF